MRTLNLIAAGIILFVSNSIHAQISVSLNIGTPPSWGPVGYEEADYYYLPDVEAYYDIRASQFIYFGGGRWVRSRYLPREYRNYDLYKGYKVVLNDYHGSRPYRNFDNDRLRYRRGYHGRPQRAINYDNQREHDDQREYDNNYSGGKEGHENKHEHESD